MNKINWTKYNKLIADGYVVKRKHPELDIWILNYSQTTQFEGAWNKETLQARGLVVDAEGTILARPFQKFFNLDELPKYKNYFHHWYKCRLDDLLTMPFRACEKMDGSLGILFNYNNKWIMASRGSFESEQAVHGQHLIDTRYKDFLENLGTHCTYLFEIIYKENRIVVDYADLDDIVLLGIVETETKEEINPYIVECLPFRVPKVFHFNNLSELTTLENTTNFEGVVLQFNNGVRAKYKTANYKALHRIMTNITPKKVLECLRNKVELKDWLIGVPDEFYAEVNTIDLLLTARFTTIKLKTQIEFNKIKSLPTRKEFACSAMKHEHPGLLFGLLDNKDIDGQIWDIVEKTIKE